MPLPDWFWDEESPKDKAHAFQEGWIANRSIKEDLRSLAKGMSFAMPFGANLTAPMGISSTGRPIDQILSLHTAEEPPKIVTIRTIKPREIEPGTSVSITLTFDYKIEMDTIKQNGPE